MQVLKRNGVWRCEHNLFGCGWIPIVFCFEYKNEFSVSIQGIEFYHKLGELQLLRETLLHRVNGEQDLYYVS
jgi:hypothetical protein